jgi:hypothetical protein
LALELSKEFHHSKEVYMEKYSQALGCEIRAMLRVPGRLASFTLFKNTQPAGLWVKPW